MHNCEELLKIFYPKSIKNFIIFYRKYDIYSSKALRNLFFSMLLSNDRGKYETWPVLRVVHIHCRK